MKAMLDFEDGVKGYIQGECTVRILFPVTYPGNTDVCCYQCKLFSRSSGICQLTKEVSEYPTKYKGSHCPLRFDGEIINILKEK